MGLDRLQKSVRHSTLSFPKCESLKEHVLPNLIASIFQAVKSCTEGYNNLQYRRTANVIVGCTDRLRTWLIARQRVFSAVYDYESVCK